MKDLLTLTLNCLQIIILQLYEWVPHSKECMLTLFLEPWPVSCCPPYMSCVIGVGFLKINPVSCSQFCIVWYIHFSGSLKIMGVAVAVGLWHTDPSCKCFLELLYPLRIMHLFVSGNVQILESFWFPSTWVETSICWYPSCRNVTVQIRSVARMDILAMITIGYSTFVLMRYCH
jgi:hypothetical protein